MGLFRKAVKSESKLRMAIAGPSGSGKTYTALAIASHLAQGKPIAVVDTEHGSASKYADLFTFDVAEMHAPFHPNKYIAAINEAAQAGYGVIILDSLTHAWTGTGGLLELVDEFAKRSKSGNTYAAWKEGTPIQNALIEGILSSGIHVIATMRSKQEFVQEKDDRGKTAIRKVGMAPIQRDGMEYEFDVVISMDVDNNGIVDKTRCPSLTGRVFTKPGKNVADILLEWLQGASAEPEQPKAASKRVDTREDVEFRQSQANGKPPVEPEPVDGNPFEDDKPEPVIKDPITPKTLQRLNIIGAEFYNGKGEWDATRPQLVEWVTQGAETSSKNLTESEGKRLISAIERKREKAQSEAQQELAKETA